MSIGVYAGSFDPFMNGHLAMVRKASMLFDKVYVVIAVNSSKQRHYPIGKMAIAMQETLKANGLDNCEVTYCEKLIADYCRDVKADFLIRGLRNNNDYNYEENIAEINKLVNVDLETIYFRADDKAQSSSMVRELFTFKKDISDYVPKLVEDVMRE